MTSKTHQPSAPKRPHPLTSHGVTRIDDYYWLRDKEDPETLKYLRSESDYLEEVMGHTQPLREALFSEMKNRIQETDTTVPEKRGDFFYYERTEAGRRRRWRRSRARGRSRRRARSAESARRA